MGRRRRPWVVVALLLGVATLAVAQTPRVDMSGWKTLRDQKLGFELRHPATWHVGRSTGTLESVVLGEPARSGVTRVVMQVFIQRGINPSGLSIEQWYADQLRRFKTEPPPTASAVIGGRTTIRRDMSRSDGRQYDFYTAINASDVFQVSIKQPAGAAGLDRTHEAVLSTITFIQ